MPGFALQVSQVALQAPLQQKPSAQKPLAHSPCAPTHAAPIGSGWHMPTRQPELPAHSLSGSPDPIAPQSPFCPPPFFAPVHAVRNLLGRTNTTIKDYDLIEANEAFAVQALADGRELGWDWDRVNVHGGAVALGHPIGASGARVLTTLLYALRDRGGSTGLATLCLGGGNGVALAVELA